MSSSRDRTWRRWTIERRLLCGDGDYVTLRDTSKNGTWVTPPGGAEERLHGVERAITLGAILRMGVTRMRLERIGES